MQYTPEQLANILDLHGKWLRGDAGWSRANLSGADLCGVKGIDTIGIKLITIHLSPYSLTYRSDTNQIHIGCRCLTAEEWLGKEGRDVAKKENMGKERIAQYKKYIRVLMKEK
jgi:hypothetical protein